MSTRDVDLAQRTMFGMWADFMLGYRNHTQLDILDLMTDNEGLPRNNAIRVFVHNDGTVDLLDFNLPTEKSRERKRLAQSEVPAWIMEAISMLRFTKERDLVLGLGFKVADDLYYVVDDGSKYGEGDVPQKP